MYLVAALRKYGGRNSHHLLGQMTGAYIVICTRGGHGLPSAVIILHLPAPMPEMAAASPGDAARVRGMATKMRAWHLAGHIDLLSWSSRK